MASCSAHVDIKPRSRDVTDGLEKAAARGMLRAVGMEDDDFAKPQIGVASSWNEITPCNLSLDRLAKAAKDGVFAAGGYPMEFGTISVSDGISMGHEGMHFSLVSREVIADSVETVMQAERLDGSVLLAGCDKSLPGMLMAAARLDLASVFLYAGSILPGRAKLSDGTERDVTIIDAFEAVGACSRGLMPREDVDAIERAICPGEGACGGMFTANTMASAAEALGMSLPGSAAPPATDRRRDGFARRSGQAVVEMLRRGITARDILTKEAFENAIAVVMAFGGSTNAVLHLLAIAYEANVKLSLADFTRIGAKVPHLANVKPFGKHVMFDVDRIGGVPVIMKALLDAGLLHGDCLTVTGETMAENLAAHRSAGPRRQGAARAEQPDPPTGGITILRGSLAPEGAVCQVSRLRLRRIRGHRKGFRAGARRAGRAGGRHDPGRRRRRDPLRRPQGRPRHAGDAGDHRRDQGRRTRQGRAADHRRPVLRRHDRIVRRAHRARGRRRRADRVPSRRRPDPPRRAQRHARRARRPGRIRLAPRGFHAAATQRYTTGVLAKYVKLVGSAAVGAVCT